MNIINNLIYKLRKTFLGEKGIVVHISELNDFEKTKCSLDDYGDYPQEITFRNPFGGFLTRKSKLTSICYLQGPKSKRKLRIYKTYFGGGNFP